MIWSPDVAFLEGLGCFSSAVAGLNPTDWELPSPCSGWSALDVLGHVGTAVDFGTRLLQDEKPAWAPHDPPGGNVGVDPQAWWEALVEPARQAVVGVDLARVVESPVGSRPIGEGLSFPALDLFVHAWDLARTVGAKLELREESIEFAHSFIDPLPAEQVRNPRVFSEELPVPPHSDSTETFIAWAGRDPTWAPPTAGAP